MTEELIESYKKLKHSEKIVVDNLLRREQIKNLIKDRIPNIFDIPVKMNPHDINVLINLFINTRQPFNTIKRFITNSSRLKKISGNLIEKTSSKSISKDLFYFTPTIGTNPMGHGEFLLAFYFPNVQKRVKSGDLIIDDRLYELKSSKNSTSGGGKVNSSKNGVYGVPDSVASKIMKEQSDYVKDKLYLNLNHTNFCKISNSGADTVNIIDNILDGIYPKIKIDDKNNLMNLYLNAVREPIQEDSELFEQEFAKFQIQYYLENHDESLLFINRDTGNLLEVNLHNVHKEFSSLKIKKTFSMKSKTNNVYQFSI